MTAAATDEGGGVLEACLRNLQGGALAHGERAQALETMTLALDAHPELAVTMLKAGGVEVLVELMASRELAVPVAKLLAKVVAAHHAAAADVAQAGAMPLLIDMLRLDAPDAELDDTWRRRDAATSALSAMLAHDSTHQLKRQALAAGLATSLPALATGKHNHPPKNDESREAVRLKAAGMVQLLGSVPEAKHFWEELVRASSQDGSGHSQSHGDDARTPPHGSGSGSDTGRRAFKRDSMLMEEASRLMAEEEQMLMDMQDMDDIEATRLLQEEMKFQDEQRSRGLPPLPPCPASPLELSPEEVEAEALLQEEWSRLGRPGSRSSRGSSSHRKVASRPGSAASSTASQWVARELARIDPQSKNAKLVPLGSFNVRSKDSSKSKDVGLSSHPLREEDSAQSVGVKLYDVCGDSMDLEGFGVTSGAVESCFSPSSRR
mmetsp:Transcript_26649/g.50635  ORF Transcript_26649/g.50635 Transcript_26649/m.50635 type:complete len:435 (+) Transcript_26649:301-1605(+)